MNVGQDNSPATKNLNKIMWKGVCLNGFQKFNRNKPGPILNWMAWHGRSGVLRYWSII